MNVRASSLAWFGRHELRLAVRDWLAMLTAGRSGRAGLAIAAVAVLVAGAHWLADALLAPFIAGGIGADRPTLLTVSGIGLLFATAMLSQALESITRVYYARGDLELILSSPAPAERLFAVRTGATALLVLALALLLASPVINVLAVRDGPHWLAAYAVLAALSALATALAVLIVLALFTLLGPARTRIVAQIVAALIGAGFVIAVQAIAILAYGDFSRLSLLQSAALLAAAPEAAHPLWLPARAAMGEPLALALLTAAGFAALALAIAVSDRGFAERAVAAAGLSRGRGRRTGAAAFRPGTPKQALRRKEWRLLFRDPWLLSQTLTQLLYLVPPALLLWVNFGREAGLAVVAVPVLVMAAGQLAGGLAWLAISGEDAHDLVVSAPISPRQVLVAKVEAVLVLMAAILAPILLLAAVSSPLLAAIIGLGAGCAAASATAIQLWFRTPLRRAMFRRRQVASRVATLAEAFVSIMWAGAAALAAAGGFFVPLALVPAGLAVFGLGLAWLLSPRGRLH